MSGQLQKKASHFSKPQTEQICARWFTRDELESHTIAWQALANVSIDPNPFYEPDYLLASLNHLGSGTKDLFLTLWSRAHDNQMLGFFPLQQCWLKHGYIRPVLSLYHSQFTVVTNPLIDPRDPVAVWQSAFEAINNRDDLPGLLNLPNSYATGASAQALLKAVSLGSHACQTLKSFKRPIVKFDSDCNEYKKGWSGKRRKNINRAIRKANEAGKITFETVTCTDGQFQAAFESFLKLESSGWKGQHGTALASTPQLKAFAMAGLAAQNQSPEIHIDQISLDGEVIAANANMISQGTAFCLKAGYNEDFSHLSPGVLLDSFLLRRALDDKHYNRLDSCAGENHYLASMWYQAEIVQNMLVAANPKTSMAALSQIKRGFDLFHAARDQLKTLRDRVKK